LAPNTHHNPIGPDHQLPAPRQHHYGITILIVLVILLIAGGVMFLIIRHRSAPQAAGGRRGAGGPVSITVATAKTGDIGVYLEAIGTVTPVYTATITSQVSGPILEVHYKEGQIVKKDDPLIEVDPGPYEATLQQAQGTLKKDQSLLAQAKMDLERYQAAWARNAIPKQTLDDQEKLVDQDAGTVENDLGTVRYDEIQVKYCHITAPIAGRVGLRLVDPGNIVQANSTTPLVVITQLDPITVVFTLPEDNIDQVVSHQTDSAKMEVDALDRTGQSTLAAGKLLALDNQIDTTTGTVKARALFPNEKNALFPNQFVNTRLLVTMLKDVTLIPSSAIQHNEQETFVYVIKPGESGGAGKQGTAAMQDITTGVSDNNLTEVKGIKAGTQVANSGFERLTDKAEVVIVPGNGAGGGATTQPTSQPGHHHHSGNSGQSTRPSEDSTP
jgi:multidrug efflux system membrane fusion protein